MAEGVPESVHSCASTTPQPGRTTFLDYVAGVPEQSVGIQIVPLDSVVAIIGIFEIISALQA